jgi:hypothetical protein
VHEQLARANFESDVANLTPVVISSCRLQVHSTDFPVLDVTVEHTKPLRLRMRADNWDELPPSVELLRPDGIPLTNLVPGGIFHAGPHPHTNRPFVCMRGCREYHTHPSHLNEAWEQHRGRDGMGLVGILMQIASGWRSHVR